MPLTDVVVRKASAGEKPVKMFDGGGLYLLVATTGAKLWRLKYRFGGKEKLLALGAYPDVTLKDAREKRDQARRTLAQGGDPGASSAPAPAGTTFGEVASEWLDRMRPTWVPAHLVTVESRLKRDVLPAISARPLASLGPADVLAVLRVVETRGSIETAHRIKQVCGAIFRYAVATGRCGRDPTADLRGALSPVVKGHFATITDPREAAGLLRAIDAYVGTAVVKAALKLAPLLFVRPGELRKAEWGEFDFESATWRIPAARMKMRVQHIVPLSTQAVAVLKGLHLVTGDKGKYLFPSPRSALRPMSNNAITAALRRMGYEQGTMTGHGFRSMASTLLNEQGWNRDAIERQLAHAERDDVRAAYNYAELLPERRRMMQAWADYLDQLRAMP